VHGEDRSPRWHRGAWLLLAILCGFFAFRGWRSAMRPAGSDFTIYWRAGRAVIEGADPSQVPDFIYLPAFAVAMVPIAAFPYPLAAGLWQALSLAALLWGARKCGALAESQGLSRPPWLAWATLACVLRLADSNLGNGQVNSLVFAIALFGIAAWLERREVRAGAWVGLAATLKLVPACLVLPMILRRGLRTAWAALGSVVICALIVPSLALGWRANLGGLEAWWRAQPAPYLRGGNALLEARRYLPGQSLTAAAYRLLAAVPATSRGEEGPDANVLDLDPETVARIVHAAQALYVAVLIATIIRSRSRDGAGAQLKEIALTIVVALTLAPLVHKAHLVWLILPYTVLLADRGERLSRAGLRLRWACVALSVALIGGTAPALLGRALATWQLAHNSIFLGLQLLLLALLVDVWCARASRT
jgi:hypothetical protein